MVWMDPAGISVFVFNIIKAVVGFVLRVCGLKKDTTCCVSMFMPCMPVPFPYPLHNIVRYVAVA